LENRRWAAGGVDSGAQADRPSPRQSLPNNPRPDKPRAASRKDAARPQVNLDCICMIYGLTKYLKTTIVSFEG
jgi:hypothetical protein